MGEAVDDEGSEAAEEEEDAGNGYSNGGPDSLVAKGVPTICEEGECKCRVVAAAATAVAVIVDLV